MQCEYMERVPHNPMMYVLLYIRPHRSLATTCPLVRHLHGMEHIHTTVARPRASSAQHAMYAPLSPQSMTRV